MPQHHDPPVNRNFARQFAAMAGGLGTGMLDVLRFPAQILSKASPTAANLIKATQPMADEFAKAQGLNPLAGFFGDVMAPGPGEAMKIPAAIAGMAPFMRRSLLGKTPHIESDWIRKNFSPSGRPKGFPFFTHGSPKHVGDDVDLLSPTELGIRSNPYVDRRRMP